MPCYYGKKEQMTNYSIHIDQHMSCMGGTVTSILSVATHLMVAVNFHPHQLVLLVVVLR